MQFTPLSCDSSTRSPSAAALTEMAREAWRNAPRCLGRLFWPSLELADARDCSTPGEVFEACLAHLHRSTNGGKIRPLITVFRESASDERGFRIWNHQLIRYAGYRAADGSILGDPAQLDFTQRAVALGWSPPTRPTAFDRLPIIIDVPGYSARWYELPDEAVLEVPLTHPDFPWFADLGLRWHALPVISDMALVGGSHYFPAAPFSGFYLGTEVACRNLCDEGRYNILPMIADGMGLNCTDRSKLWKDRALIEVNTAVLHSYREAGVTMVDHHTASEQFMQFFRKEEAAGRSVAGDWSWLVPPLSGSTMEVFHHYYESAKEGPAFVAQSNAWEDGGVGSPARCPFHG